eukprot:jgi/Ulvmu1/1262/UM109_0060.1
MRSGWLIHLCDIPELQQGAGCLCGPCFGASQRRVGTVDATRFQILEMMSILSHVRSGWRSSHVHRVPGTLLRSAAAPSRDLTMQRPMHTHSGTEMPVYCSYPLDRAANLRTEESQATLTQMDSASLILLSNGSALCTKERMEGSNGADVKTQDVALAPVSPARLFVGQSWIQQVVFLGVDRTGSPVYAGHTNSTDVTLPDGFEGAEWLDIRQYSVSMSPGDAAMAATANGLLQWHKANKFSEDTGDHAASVDAGWARKSASSARSTYARVDPAVIVIATCNDHILLGRNVKWPAGRYSALAGFVEIGESLEEAACREVLEESNVTIALDKLSYVESQPWPFPRSLMVAFRAEVPVSSDNDGATEPTSKLSAAARAAAIDTRVTKAEIQRYISNSCPSTLSQEDELADVRWFHWQWVARTQGWLNPEVETDSFFIPGRASLANRMMQTVVKEQLASWDGAYVCDCIIDEGSFKYVLIRVSSVDAQESKLIVRGFKSCEYHNDVLQRTKRQLQGTGLTLDVCGGGRITHDPSAMQVAIFGYSVAFGPAVHEISAAIVRQQFPLYHNVTVSYEGY